MTSYLHAKQGVVISLQVSRELSKCGSHQLLNVLPLFPGDSGRETESVNGPTNTNPGGLNRGVGVDVSLDLGHVHVGLVLKVSLEAVVLQDDGLKDILEVLVRVSISSVDSTVLVVEVDGTSNSLHERNSG